jgi:trehalose 6-phosphate synthase
VLVLSEHAGAHAELGEYALSVHPIDIEQQAVALHRALFMPEAERQARRDGCVRVIRENGLDRWLMTQVDELRGIGVSRQAPS